MMNRTDVVENITDYRPGRKFFVANLDLIDQSDAPLASLVTEWVTLEDSSCAPANGAAPADGTSRSLLTFSPDVASSTRAGAFTILLRFARERVTQLSAFLSRLDEEILLSEDSESMAAAHVRPSGDWEVNCSRCKRVVHFSKTARDVVCEKCKRVLIRNAASLQEQRQPSSQRSVFCLSDLPEEFTERVAPDTFLLAFVQRGTDEFAQAGSRPDASGKYVTIGARELPGQRHPTRRSALDAMRETVQSRLAHLSKQRARLAREIA